MGNYKDSWFIVCSSVLDQPCHMSLLETQVTVADPEGAQGVRSDPSPHPLF